MNTDGVPLFKSSKVTIWPLYLVTNELPYSKCVANKNMIFASFWFGEKKPTMWTVTNTDIALRLFILIFCSN